MGGVNFSGTGAGVVRVHTIGSICFLASSCLDYSCRPSFTNLLVDAFTHSFLHLVAFWPLLGQGK
jgi:hypothetical protein